MSRRLERVACIICGNKEGTIQALTQRRILYFTCGNVSCARGDGTLNYIESGIDWRTLSLLKVRLYQERVINEDG